jgi:hypothetical protein
MSEGDFKKLKQWFWTFLLGQLFVIVLSGAIFVGSFKTTLGQNSDDIKTLKDTKADLQTVLRIKQDGDIRDQMILEQLKQLNEGQQNFYKLLVDHTNKDKR